MGGGGGGDPFVNRSPEQLAKQVRQAEDDTAIKVFEIDLNSLLGELLASANSRDIGLVQERLDEIKEELTESLETSTDLLFGGSVAKHTYVDGLSDIASLLILNDSGLEAEQPSVALARRRCADPGVGERRPAARWPPTQAHAPGHPSIGEAD